jgi:hypothetical protein
MNRFNEDQRPLTNSEKFELQCAGWEFSGEDYIYIPDDEDGCMASGIKNIRRVLEGVRRSRNRNFKV